MRAKKQITWYTKLDEEVVVSARTPVRILRVKSGKLLIRVQAYIGRRGGDDTAMRRLWVLPHELTPTPGSKKNAALLREAGRKVLLIQRD